jgi:Xaa-Pro aminopeptidase
MSHNRFARRRGCLRNAFDDHGIDALLVTGNENVAWLSGFTGDSSALLIDRSRGWFVTDFRYTEQASFETSGLDIVEHHKGIGAAVANLAAENGLRRLGIESSRMTVKAFNELDGKLHEALDGNVALVPLDGAVDSLRRVKDDGEIDAIVRALDVAQGALEAVLAEPIPPTERALADKIEFAMRERGAERAAFDIIVATGSHRSLPHYRPGDTPLDPDEPILIDFGARVEGYNSDLTRMVGPSSIGGDERDIHRICLEAQRYAIEHIRPGMTAGDADALARDRIVEAGYGERFGHSLGHGVGLEVHEGPGIRKESTEVLKPGMVFTVEPGIYLPGSGGVRIEDMVLVTDTGVRVLSRLPKDIGDLQFS